jgi:hypothetical protein
VTDDLRVARYVAEMGHEPPHDSSEGAWQWDYRGLVKEREMLLDLIQQEAEEALADQLSLC